MNNMNQNMNNMNMNQGMNNMMGQNMNNMNNMNMNNMNMNNMNMMNQNMNMNYSNMNMMGNNNMMNQNMNNNMNMMNNNNMNMMGNNMMMNNNMMNNNNMMMNNNNNMMMMNNNNNMMSNNMMGQNNMMNQSGRIEVHIVGCLKLKKADTFGKSDPYVVVKCKGKSYKTEVKKQTLSPCFDQSFIFDGVCGSDHLSLEVFDWDRVGDHDSLGVLTIPFAQLPYNKMFYDTYDLQQVHRGKICVGCRPLGWGQTNMKLVPKLRYMKLGGSDGKWKWETSKGWGIGFEMKCKVDGYGKMHGKNKMDFKHATEWNEIDGIYQNGYINVKAAKVYANQKNNHTNTNCYAGKIDQNGYFRGAGQLIWKKGGGKVGKKCYCEGKVKFTGIPIKFWKKVKNVKFYDGF